MTSFHAPDPAGFGLIQRDPDFEHYQDLEARYETRPSVWISPVGKWGEGRVELIQIPTDKEINDNIIAFWTPDRLPEKGRPIWFSYRMLWHYPGPSGRLPAVWWPPELPRGKMTRRRCSSSTSRRAAGVPSGGQTAHRSCNRRARGKLIEQQLYKNSVTGGWRLAFQISFEDASPLEKVLPAIRRPVVELRAFLKLGDNALTETWSYPINREECSMSPLHDKSWQRAQQRVLAYLRFLNLLRWSTLNWPCKQ